MRKLIINSNNTEVYVSGWSIYLNDKDINQLITENMEKGTFRAKVTISIEELEQDFTIDSNYVKEPEPETEQETEQETQEN